MVVPSITTEGVRMALAELLREESDTTQNSGEFPRFSDGEEQGELTPDPTPGKAPRKRTRAAAKAPTVRPPAPVSRAVATRNISEELQVYAGMIALTVSARGDQVCSAAISAQSKELADALAALIARSDWLMSTVHSGGLIRDIVKVAMAGWPIVAAVRAHHGGVREGAEGERADDLAGFAPYRPA